MLEEGTIDLTPLIKKYKKIAKDHEWYFRVSKTRSSIVSFHIRNLSLTCRLKIFIREDEDDGSDSVNVLRVENEALADFMLHYLLRLNIKGE